MSLLGSRFDVFASATVRIPKQFRFNSPEDFPQPITRSQPLSPVLIASAAAAAFVVDPWDGGIIE